jgi:hypothetical protein
MPTRDMSSRDVLDWQAFSASRFPASRRHDLKALVAYGTYRRQLSVVETTSDANESNALDDWENEGGPVSA